MACRVVTPKRIYVPHLRRHSLRVQQRNTHRNSFFVRIRLTRTFTFLRIGWRDSIRRPTDLCHIFLEARARHTH